MSLRTVLSPVIIGESTSEYFRHALAIVTAWIGVSVLALLLQPALSFFFELPFICSDLAKLSSFGNT
jgi:hypothetical protein